MSKSKLRPCPFCGGVEDLDIDTGNDATGKYWAVSCCDCGAYSGSRHQRREAIATWNTRDGQSLNDQLWCLIEIRKLLGDPEAKLMQSELIEKVRELVSHFRDATKKAKGEKG